MGSFGMWRSAGRRLCRRSLQNGPQLDSAFGASCVCVREPASKVGARTSMRSRGQPLGGNS
eukprot:7661662-Alexandrium_andersonii.AAC.1